jgi:hypothetical protein
LDCVFERIQLDGITPNKQTAAAGAILDDPYHLAVVGAVVNMSCVEERIDGPDFHAVAGLKGGPILHRLLAGALVVYPEQSRCLLIHFLFPSWNRYGRR